MTDFYVYIHRKATTGEVFYVGKGHGDRAYEFGRNDHWNKTARKHGFSVKIVETGLQEWYALELEMDLIALYGRNDLGYGTLVNWTDGGEGVSGLIHSKETKQKLKSISTGNTSAKGHTVSAQARAIISAKLTNPTKEFRKILSESHKGKVNPPETRAKISLSNTGRKPTEETLQKLRKPKSEEHRKNISLGKTGKPFSDSHKKALSEARIAVINRQKGLL